VTRIEFGEPEQTTIRDLTIGDFVVVIPTQERLRGVRVNSAVQTITGRARGWRLGQGASRRVVPSRVLTFVSAGEVDRPSHFTVTVRRPIAP